MPGPPLAAAEWIEAANVFIWPVLAVVAITLLLTTRTGRQFRHQIQRLTFGGFEVELTPGQATATKTEVEGRLKAYAEALDAEFARVAHLYQVEDRLEAVYEATRELLTNEEAKETYRATVHVVDALYDEGFYQLLDYVPSGTGAGRRKSARFGILGLAWRLEQSIERTEVPVEPRELIMEWGMTKDEARWAGKRSSLACVMLRDENKSRLGVLYLDAVPEHSFPDDFAAKVEGLEGVRQLEKAVKQVRDIVAASGPAIKIYGGA